MKKSKKGCVFCGLPLLTKEPQLYCNEEKGFFFCSETCMDLYYKKLNNDILGTFRSQENTKSEDDLLISTSDSSISNNED